MLIGIHGRAGAGKDTIAKMLPAKYYPIPLARDLKECASVLFGVAVFNQAKELPSPKLLGHSPRYIYQTLGTAIRKSFGEDIFCKLHDLHPREGDQVIPDIRYQNEAKWLLSKPDSILIVVTRPGDSIPLSDHASEAGLDIPDLLCPDRIYHICNDGTLEDLRIKVEKLATLIQL